MTTIEAEVIDPEILLKSLIKSVANFYEKYYLGQYVGKRNYHIRKVIENYDKERFSHAENLYEERLKFLEEMQNIVDNEYVGAF